jgi:hypothetical protein
LIGPAWLGALPLLLGSLDGAARPAASFESPALTPSYETVWLSVGLESKLRFRLAPEPTLNLLGRYLRPWENHTPDWRSFLAGRYAPFRSAPLTFTWRLAPELEPVTPPISAIKPCPRWQRPRPLTVLRYAGESETLALFDCEGAIAPEVIDRLSVLARAPDSARPALPLPDEAANAERGEWLPGVHLIDPRLTWVLGELQAAFPKKAIVIMSGYRPDAHTSFHKRGKALDLYVQDVPNEELFAVCRKLRDVACGYYPNNRFVHVDVRPYGTGRVTWVDVSDPGETSRYVDGFPGVLEPGIGWLGR